MGMTPEQEAEGRSCCGCMVLTATVATVIVLIVGSIVGYRIWRGEHHSASKMLQEQTVTLTSGSDYAFTSSGDLKRASGTAAYLLRVNSSGVSFPPGVHAGNTLTVGGKYQDLCRDLDLSSYGNAASFPWKRLKAGTRAVRRAPGPGGGV